MGFPMVTIDTATGRVSQDHFLLDPDSEVTVKSPYRWVGHNLRRRDSWSGEEAGSAALTPTLFCRYTWLVPVRWMKSGQVQTPVWWLTEKEGVWTHTRQILVVVAGETEVSQ